jgi:hypothetical protein
MKLTIALFASALAFASSPGLAVDLPDYGSKNFSPSDGTPTYFANENVSVSARTADATERDWSAVDAIAPARPVGHARWAHRVAGTHGRYTFAHASGRHTTSSSAGRSYGTGSSSVRYHAATVGAGKTMSAKHGRLGGRHASTATHDTAI